MRSYRKLGFWGLAMLLFALLALLVASVWAATTLTAKLEIKASSRFVNALDLSTPADLLSLDLTQNFTSGTGNKQVSVVFHDKRTLADAATENLDLAGSLTNAFGASVTFTKVKALVVKNLSITQTVSLGGAATFQFINWVADVTDIINIPPEGVFVLTAPNAGFAVTAGTGDLLKVANAAGAAADYEIWIIGN